jgi:hypothetical protein
MEKLDFKMDDGFGDNQIETKELQKTKFVYFDMSNPAEPIPVFDCEVMGGIEEADEAYENYMGKRYVEESHIARTVEE